jgi:hypothetical protein
MDNAFLPKGYTAPKNTGNYYKLEKGDNRFRILSSAIIGYEYWTKENKPVRSRKQFTSVPADAKLNDKGQFAPKHFWAFLVWNYDEKKVQVMEITQTTIMAGIEAFVKNPKWGAPQGYDIVVHATGDGMEREYNVVPEPHSEAPKADISLIFLDALFDGGDPFNSTTSDGSSMPNFDVQPEDIPESVEEPSIS